MQGAIIPMKNQPTGERPLLEAMAAQMPPNTHHTTSWMISPSMVPPR